MAQKAVTVLSFEGDGFWRVRFEGETGGILLAALISTERLEHLVEEGYRIEDPKHLLDFHGPESMQTEEGSPAEIDRESAYGDRDVTVRVQRPDWRVRTA